MRALRLLALAAALVVPAAAAHAQYGVYVNPAPVYAAPAYGAGWVPGHWQWNGYSRFWVPAHRIGGYDGGHFGGYFGYRGYEHHDWHRGYYGHRW